MERRSRIFKQGLCVECKGPTLRIDGMPLCSQCEKKLTEKAARVLSKMSDKGKIELQSEAVLKT